jgi:hypothetical protein
VEDKQNVFPPVGMTFKKLMELEKFDELVTQVVPTHTLKGSKKLLEEMKGSPVTAAVKIWFAAVTLAMRKLEQDCKQARVDINQDDMDRITYFANKLIKAFGTKPHVPILISELLKDHYEIDFSDLKGEEQRYEKMLGIIDEAVEKKI